MSDRPLWALSADSFMFHSLLYVEDHTSVRETTVSVLRPYARLILEGRSGQEGVGLFMEYGADVLVTDFRMPGMNGLEMLKKIRQIDPMVPAVFTTSENDSSILESIRSLTHVRLLDKPCTFEELTKSLSWARQQLQISR